MQHLVADYHKGVALISQKKNFLAQQVNRDFSHDPNHPGESVHCVCVYVSVCLCVSACVCANICIYICTCVCVCVCVRTCSYVVKLVLAFQSFVLNSSLSLGIF